jgi:folate-binding protein YgfZ
MTTDHSAETLLIEGPDAMAFAQGQFSSNVHALSVGQWQFSAWLDAQGRVRALFHLARIANDALLLLLRGGDAESLAQGLQRFVFRAKVKLSAQPARALGTGPVLDTYAFHSDGDSYVYGCGTHSLVVGHTPDDSWRLLQIREGWPWLPASAIGELLPPAISLERLQAVAFDKGCYPGQEIVARLHYRGGLKRHMHCVVLSPTLAGGTVLRQNGKTVGQLLDAVHDEGGATALAVMDDDVIDPLKSHASIAIDESVTLRVVQSWSA